MKFPCSHHAVPFLPHAHSMQGTRLRYRIQPHMSQCLSCPSPLLLWRHKLFHPQTNPTSRNAVFLLNSWDPQASSFTTLSLFLYRTRYLGPRHNFWGWATRKVGLLLMSWVLTRNVGHGWDWENGIYWQEILQFTAGLNSPLAAATTTAIQSICTSLPVDYLKTKNNVIQEALMMPTLAMGWRASALVSIGDDEPK